MPERLLPLQVPHRLVGRRGDGPCVAVAGPWPSGSLPGSELLDQVDDALTEPVGPVVEGWVAGLGQGSSLVASPAVGNLFPCRPRQSP
jgi:hypothetical protein